MNIYIFYKQKVLPTDLINQVQANRHFNKKNIANCNLKKNFVIYIHAHV